MDVVVGIYCVGGGGERCKLSAVQSSQVRFDCGYRAAQWMAPLSRAQSLGGGSCSPGPILSDEVLKYLPCLPPYFANNHHSMLL